MHGLAGVLGAGVIVESDDQHLQVNELALVVLHGGEELAMVWEGNVGCWTSMGYFFEGVRVSITRKFVNSLRPCGSRDALKHLPGSPDQRIQYSQHWVMRRYFENPRASNIVAVSSVPFPETLFVFKSNKYRP